MADIYGINNAIKVIELNEATAFAIHKNINEPPLFKHNGKQLSKCLSLFKDIAQTLSKNTEYYVVITNSNDEQIKFSFANTDDDKKTEPTPHVITPQNNIDVTLIEYKIKNEFLNKEIKQLETTIEYLEKENEELLKEISILKEATKDPRNKLYEKLNDVLENQGKYVYLSENTQNTSQKKELIKQIILILNKNFNEVELNKLANYLKNNTAQIKSMIKQ